MSAAREQRVEKPILFSAPMAYAAWRRIKTMTRRLVVPGLRHPGWTRFTYYERSGIAIENGPGYPDGDDDVRRPSYQPGDTLYVRCPWRTTPEFDHLSPREIVEAGGARIFYEGITAEADVALGRYRHARFMPRAISPFSVRVKAVRVERVNEISYEDAVAEGWDLSTKMHPIEWYRELWDALNAHRGYRWLDAPWVWVYEFEHCEAQRAA